MKALALAVALMVAAAHQAAGQGSERMKRIWGAFDNRVNSQADLWFEKGEFPRTVQALRVLVYLHPKNYEMITDLGWMLENIERWDEALGLYVQFRKSNPGDADAAFPEAWFHYQKRAYAKVPPLLEPTLKMNRRPHANAYRILAQAYERLGQLPDSLRIYKLLRTVLPNDPNVTRNIEKIEKKIREGEAKPKPPASR
jgi:tetratricopeptide (TPR) repeat protein